MKRLGFKSMVIGAVILLDAALVLFPDWVAVHANDPTWTMSAGYSWLTSPPPPPKDFSLMHVRKGSAWIWDVIFVSVMGFLACAIDLTGAGGLSDK
jgi:hypothetical protein